ncbi:hypothetical protein K2173_015063 [Erythroxylum novogranatense]|uniref:F-box domain-containing protein n=1 Tax=Erythroxylum novogranatense TaxID=1862640 RepID=A0AAV8T1Y2_9ROSI|nr:hypothetical protein K2173_015063 [Erythroxylum novogranatense]
MSELAEDIELEILSKLCVKSLLRLRCVSKTWISIISSNYFVKCHLKKRTSSLIFGELDDNGVQHISLDGNQLSNPFYLPIKITCASIIGSCNGLVCIQGFILRIPTILLWNPSVRTYRYLPPTSFTAHDVGVFGFGYDSMNDDYLVMNLVPTNSRVLCDHVSCYDTIPHKYHYKSRLELWVYRLQRHRWTRIDVPYWFTDVELRVNSLFVHEACHWLINIKSTQVIVAFHTTTEKLERLSLPMLLSKEKNKYYLGVLGDWLCVSCMQPKAVKGADIWVMKEYGIEDSWVKLFSFSCEALGKSIDRLVPISFSKNKERILLKVGWKVGKGALVWYDPETNTAERLPYYHTCAYTFVESLVKTINGRRIPKKRKLSDTITGLHTNDRLYAYLTRF